MAVIAVSGAMSQMMSINYVCRACISKVTRSISTDVEPKAVPTSSSPDDLPPLVRTLKASSERNSVMFNFPGHKRGRSAPLSLTDLIGPNPFLHDVTEIPELDRFSRPTGPLLEAQQLAAHLFGAHETWFLVGGSSCGINAAIMACCSPGDTLVLPRNAHTSATTGLILSGAEPKYIVPRYNEAWDIAAGVTPLQVRTAIEESRAEGKRVGGVFVTSPTYNGICSHLTDISEICRSFGVPLLVDEAHGAHFKFGPRMPKTALEQGADIAVQSTHKVLCSLSQSSMLHVSSRGGLMIDRGRLHKCLHSLQTTSPNWLLLASLDAARHQLSASPETIFDEAVKLADEARASIGGIPGMTVLDLSDFADFTEMDPLRITIGVRKLGLSGYEANRVLDGCLGIVSELFSMTSITLVFSLGTTEEDVERLVSGLKQLSSAAYGKEKEKAIVLQYDEMNPLMALSPREAFFARKVVRGFENCVGEVCGESVCPFPPGIPTLVPGEVITEKALDYLREIKRHGGFIMGPADPLLDTIVVCDKK